MKKKILVYDTSKGYCRFLKLNFNNEFEVKSFFEYGSYEDVNFDEFETAFFIVNQPSELLDLFVFYSKIGQIFLGSRSAEINRSIKNFDGVVFLDLLQKRQEMVDSIKFNLSLL